eukprot:gene12213-25643_t
MPSSASTNITMLPFKAELLGFDYSTTTWIELTNESKLYQLILSHIAKNLVYEDHPKSFSIDVNQVSDAGNESLSRTRLSMGLGLFSFLGTRGQRLLGLHQAVGSPVGTSCGVQWYKTLVVFSLTAGSQSELNLFCDDLIKASEATEAGNFTIFTWHIRHQYWREEAVCKARAIESVILAPRVKDKLFNDVDRFLDTKTQNFYEKHGIPYRRSYLFHGVPGAGKTSLIQALAGKLNRNLYFVQPTDPQMTDDSLRSAISKVAANAIIVIEDIDALFAKDRSKKVQQSPLTFSGLLNALDGVGGSS